MRLSQRERQITALVHKGRNNDDIARLLGIENSTVRIYLCNLYEKLELKKYPVNNRIFLAVYGPRILRGEAIEDIIRESLTDPSLSG